MDKIKKIIVSLTVVIAVFCFYGSSIKADDITVAFEDDSSGTKCIDINKLAKQMNVDVKKGNDFKITINGKKLSFNENDGYVLVDGNVATLKTKSVLDVNSKEKYNLPIISRVEKNDEGGYLIPVDFLTNYFGLETNDSGVVVPSGSVKAEQKQEETKTDTNNNSTDNSQNGLTDRRNNTYNNDNDSTYPYTGGSSGGDNSETQPVTPAPDNSGDSSVNTPQAPQGGEDSGSNGTPGADQSGEQEEVSQE